MKILWKEEEEKGVGRYYGRRKVEGSMKILWKEEGGKGVGRHYGRRKV